MYEAFYGLREKPFNLTPDPKYLYLSEKHREAFGHLRFGIKNRSGFAMVTGEIGTGKTTICRTLLNQLDPDTVLAFVFNPSLSPVELLKRINEEFGIDATPDTALDLVGTLNTFLLKASAEGKNCVLVIDEAQNLSPQVLEQIRLLSNLETETEKLLQIILLGQPELLEKLALTELRQLNQRITTRYHLKALDLKETLEYIAYRLHVAGAKNKIRFTKSAVKAVFKYSQGTPRVINAICDRALLIGYTRESHTISPRIVAQSAREVQGEKIKPRKVKKTEASDASPVTGWKRWLPSPTMILAAILVLVVVKTFATPVREAARQLGAFNALLSPASSKTDATSQGTAAPLPDSEVSKQILERLHALEVGNSDARGVSAEAMPREFDTLSEAEALEAAANAILRAWNVAMLGAAPESGDPAALVRFLTNNGFACETLMPALDQLAAVNLPALVRVQVGPRMLWLALLGAENGRIRLSTRNGEAIETTRDALRGMYAWQAIIPWQDPAPKAPSLSLGKSNEFVARLKEQLRSLKRLPDTNTSSIFDDATAAAVRRLQAETGLTVDGVAGKQVRMVLSSWAPSQPTPSLNAHANDRTVAVAPAEQPAAAPVASAAAPIPEPVAKVAPAPVVETKKPVDKKKPETKPEPSAAPANVEPAPKPAPPKQESNAFLPPVPPATPKPAETGPIQVPLPSTFTPPKETPEPAPATTPASPPASLLSEQPLPAPGEAPAAPATEPSVEQEKEVTPPAAVIVPLVPQEDADQEK